MPKVLSQSGMSLADLWDVEGSIAGVEELTSREVGLTHEMGATLFSERIFGSINRLTSGALLQNISFDVTLFPNISGVHRISQVLLFADVAGRTDRAQISINLPVSLRDMPLAVWDVNDGGSLSANIRFADGGAAGNQVALIPSLVQTPALVFGPEQPNADAVGPGEFVLRGLTSGFGAGTVTISAFIYSSRTDIDLAGATSFGLPVPSW